MSSLPSSSTPSADDDSAPGSLVAAEAVAESVSAPAADPAVEATPAAGPASAPEDCGPQLKQLYPALFSNPPKPLKLRIQADIQARSPGLFTKPQLSAFLRRYTGSHGYLNAIVKATHRYDLDGTPGDELSDEHRQAAIDELARRRANTQARRTLEDEQRFNRATLLREFGVNTLPVAEFAAAKGVPEAELEPLLERARKEALEPPPVPMHRDRRGPPNRAGRGEGGGGHTAGGERNGAGPRPARAPRDANGAPRAPQGDRAQHADRPTPAPRAEGAPTPHGEGTPAPRGDGPRGPRTDAPRADGPRGPRPEGARGPRPESQRGPRPDTSRGPRADGPRNPNGQRNDDRRGPRPDAPRGGRPDVVSSPAMPTAMALAFSALRNVNAAPSAEPASPAPAGKPGK